MSTPFMGEIRLLSFNFAPKGWTLCQGQLLPINQNQALFSILGTTYGGDGRVNFALPNLQGRKPVHPGTSYTLGQLGGSFTATLSLSNLPAHSHTANGDSGASNTDTPSASALLGNPGTGTTPQYYSTGNPTVTMSPSMVANAGSGQPFQLGQPYLALNFAIALVGIFPSRN